MFLICCLICIGHLLVQFCILPLYRSVGRGVSPAHPLRTGEGTAPPERRGVQGDPPQIFFHFKIVHSGAFSYTNPKVLFILKAH